MSISTKNCNQFQSGYYLNLNYYDKGLTPKNLSQLHSKKLFRSHLTRNNNQLTNIIRMLRGNYAFHLVFRILLSK